jgi:tetratricopeptide (TPR) repeat protein
MKKLRLIILLLGVMKINSSYSQSQEECLNNLSIFAESAKVKNYDSAYDTWKFVLESCPKINLAVYTYGERILKHKIKNSSGEEQENFKKSLVLLYDKWILNFPNKKGVSRVGNILSTKAQVMIDYKMANDAEVYKVFDQAYKKDPESFTNPKGLYNYFNTLYKQYKSGENNVTPEHLFNMYEEISEKFELEATKLAKKLDKILIKIDNDEPLTNRETKNKRVYEVNSRAIGIFLSNLDAIISIEATCNNLIPLYKRNFGENKLNSVWLKRAASRMDGKDCSDDPFFVTLVESLHNIEPSAD